MLEKFEFDYEINLFHSPPISESRVFSHETKCSVKCGNGTKVITTVDCNHKEGKCRPEKRVEPCQHPMECPKVYKYGEWGSWSQCSRSCIRSRAEPAFKERCV